MKNIKSFLSLMVLAQLLFVPVFSLQAAPKDNLTEEEQAELDAKKAEAEVNAGEAKTQARETGEEVAEELGLEFSELQDKLITMIDKAVDAVENAQNAISGLYYMSDETKTEVNDTLMTLEAALLDYRTAVNNATTIEELYAINDEVIQLLKDNKEVIAEAIKESALIIAEQVEKTLEKIQIRLESMLATLAVDCDSEAVDELQTELDALDVLIEDLKVAIEAEDQETAEALVKEAVDMVPDLITSATQTLTECQEDIEDLAS